MELTTADVRAWLAEDIGKGDLTSEALLSADARCAASLLLNEPGVVSGLAVCEAVFGELDPEIDFDARFVDGDLLEPGELARVEGSARAVLAGERLASTCSAACRVSRP
jgi:nicotinate-nucleotide pyrophosphorylase (carboxylating)